MKIMKKTFTALSALMIVFLMSVTVYAAALTKEDAVDKALSDAGLSASQVTKLKSEKDGGDYEIKFISTADGTKYEYGISAKSGRIREMSAEYAHERNFSSKKVSKGKAYKAVAEASGLKLSEVKSGTCKLKKDDGEWVYKIKFKSGKCKYEYEVLAPTGKVVEFEIEYKGK